MVFFVIFVWTITFGFWGTDKAITTTDEEKAQRRRQRMKVVIKMFIVMGLTWIADIVSWAITLNGLSKKFNNKGLLYSEVFFDCINSLQVSCLISVCRPHEVYDPNIDKCVRKVQASQPKRADLSSLFG